jgi:Rod binding domain-containing protein
MESYSSVNPLLFSQPAGAEIIDNLHKQKNVNKDAVDLKKASQDFESILVNFAIKAMWKTIPKSELFEESDGGMETYTEIMHTILAQDIAAKGGFGVAQVIYKQLMHEKERAENPHKPSSVKDDKPINDLSGNEKEKLHHTMSEKAAKGVIQS